MKAPRKWEPALAHRKVRSNTGFAGISKSKLGERPALRVTWRDARNQRSGTTIYYQADDAASYADALERARQIRAAHLAARMEREGKVLP